MLKVLELSELFEPNRIEINRIETKSIESNRNQSNRIEFRVRIKFESFTVSNHKNFWKSCKNLLLNFWLDSNSGISWNNEPNRTESAVFLFPKSLIHSKAIKQISVQSNRTRKKIEILKKFGFWELTFNSIRFNKRGKF